jgi:hypothetical protein
MQPRVRPPQDQVEYFLDCAQEASEMDACTAMTLRLYGDDDAVMGIIARPQPHTPPTTLSTGGHYRNRRKVCLDLADLADTILPLLSEQRRAGLIAMGLKYLNYEIHQLAETMSYMCMEDEIDGGCLTPYRRKAERCRNGVTFKSTDRRLHSPKFIRRYVKHHAGDAGAQLIELNKVMMRRANHTCPAPDRTVHQDYQRQLDHHRQETNRRIGLMVQNERDGLPALDFNVKVKLRRDAIRKRRKVIRRSIDVALSLLGRETVSSFLRGDPIKLMGTETMLMIQKRGRIDHRGHGALSIAIADAGGKTLADLCTFIEDTPALDQLCGFALWMNAGEERKVLETANITHMHEGAHDHPLIVARRQQQAASTLAGLDDRAREQVLDILNGRPRRVVHQLSHEARLARAAVYFEKTKGEWLEALLVAVVGYRNFPIYKQAGAL